MLSFRVFPRRRARLPTGSTPAARGRTPTIVCGRKFCTHPDHQGPSWLLINEFWPRKRFPAPRAPELNSYCKTCQGRACIRFRARARKGEYTPLVPVAPFRAWLRLRVNESGSIASVARTIDVSGRRVSTFLEGYSIKRGVRYEIKRVRLSTVDAWMTSFGENFNSIYGEIPEHPAPPPRRQDARGRFC